MKNQPTSRAAKQSAAEIFAALERSERQTNRMILIGAPTWVSGMIVRFHASRIVEAGNWSKLIPTGKPDEVISVMRRIRGGCDRSEE